MTQNELPQSLTAFIPKNLDLDKVLNENPPNFIYHKDNFVYLIDLTYKLHNQERLDEFGDIYSRPHSALMQRRIRNYREHLDYLVENKILFEDRQYIKNKQSRGFAFSYPYHTEPKEVQITDKKLIRKILKFYHLEESKPIIETDDSEISHLLQCLESGKLKIDFRKAKAYLRKLYMQERNTPVNLKNNQSGMNEQEFLDYSAKQKYYSRLRPLQLFHKGTFNAKLDSTAGRLHSVLTQLKSELRQFITFDGKRLVAVDIVNSQPYLSCVLFNKEKFINNAILPKIRLYNNSLNSKLNARKKLCKTIENASASNSVNHYIEIVKSGKLYEEFGQLLVEKGILEKDDDDIIRKQAKKIVFSSIFSPNQSIAYNKAVKIFKESFPYVYDIYSSVKKGKHRTLACTLQNLEANLVLFTACKIISEQRPEIPLLTLHDAIITTEGNEQFVYEVLYEVLSNGIGIPPTLKFERWEKAA